MTTLAHAIDDDAYDLLHLLADQQTAPSVSRGERERFLAACEADARAHGGLVSSQRVREALTAANDPLIDAPQRLSCMWTVCTGAGRPMMRLTLTERGTDTKSRNSAKRFPLRRWVGER